MGIIHTTFDNNNLGVNILTISNADGNPFFKCRDLASTLGYKKPNDATRERLHPENKVSYEDVKRALNHRPYEGVYPHTLFTNDSGLFTLILCSRLLAE